MTAWADKKSSECRTPTIDMRRYDFFISYRRSESADKAEHLLSLLEKEGYKNRISFDRENLSGLFDLLILRRIDDCTDFILLVGPKTFENISEEQSDEYRRLAKLSIEDFDLEQQRMLAQGKRIDFVRLEICRAIERGKNIVVVAQAASDGYDFNRLDLPSDIRTIQRNQTVFYYNDKNFMFRTIVPQILRLCKSRKKPISKWLLLTIAALAIVTLATCAFYAYQRRQTDSEKTDTLITDRATVLKDTYDTEIPDSAALSVNWADEASLTQVRAIKTLADQMMHIPPAQFTMGSDEFKDIEGPSHKVSLTEPYYMSCFEVTNGLWADIMGEDDTADRELPKTNVSWNQAIEFVERLNQLVVIRGWHFALPTEAQWEYAATGGESHPYAGSDKLNEVTDTSLKGTPAEVGASHPNAFELYDMTGNVKEWCADGSYRRYDTNPQTNPLGEGVSKIIRGGSFRDLKYIADEPWIMSVHFRDSMHPESASDDVGFRLCLIPK